MKTLQEAFELLGQYASFPNDACTHKFQNYLAEIQKDAFEAGKLDSEQAAFSRGWEQGMRDSVDMTSKGIDPQRAIDGFTSSIKSPRLIQ